MLIRIYWDFKGNSDEWFWVYTLYFVLVFHTSRTPSTFVFYIYRLSSLYIHSIRVRVGRAH